jgi:serine/threonine-protein kinase
MPQTATSHSIPKSKGNLLSPPADVRLAIGGRQGQRIMIGDRLGKWSLYSELGRGGMGQVYLAQEEMTGRLGAVKILTPELAQDPGFRQRFLQEVETLSKLDHPSIVRLYDSGVEGDVYFYAMEYVEGESLEQILLREKRLPWNDVLDLALQVAPALKHAHDHGIIHRDLKPGNLLRSSSGMIKLSDFGIAKVFAGGHLTATGALVGTAEYIAPEQAEGKPVTQRSDLYSLGVVLYLLLTGRPVFEGKGPMDLLHKHRYAQFDPPQKIVPAIPYELNDLVCHLLEKDPARRPADAMVVARELKRIKKKMERKSEQTAAWVPAESTQADDGIHSLGRRREGPATLMSRLMRNELDREKHGGGLRRFINQPVILVAGLLVCIAFLVYAFWPPSAATLFARGAELMKSEYTSDWKRAFDEYFDPLEQNFPDNPYHKDIEQFRHKLENALSAQEPGPSGEAERFYHRAERLQEEGKWTDAKGIFQNLIQVFEPVPAEKPWVDRARQQLTTLEKIKSDDKRWQSVRASLDKAAELNRQGKRAEAERIWHSIEQLYAGDAATDPAVAKILQEVKRARQQKSKG